MRNVLFKDALRCVKRNISRFISMVAIVALGISVFVGFSSIAPDMKLTVDQYFHDANIMDIQVMSTVGLTETDVASIRGIEGVTQVVPEKFCDALLNINGEAAADVDGSRLSVRVLSLDINAAYNHAQGVQDDPNYLNRPQLLKGSWPTAATQCLVDESVLSTPDGLKIGATVSVEADAGETDGFTGKMQNTEFTVVGIVRSPLYISYDRGHTTVASGKLSCFIYVPSDNFTMDYYPMLWCKVGTAENYDPYSKEYKAFIAPYVQQVTVLTQANVQARAASLKAEYEAKVRQAEQEYANGRSQAQIQLAEAKKALDEVLDLANNGDAKVQQLQEQYNQLAAQANTEIDNSKLQWSDEYARWEEKRDKYNQAEALVYKYRGAEDEYNTARNSYNSANTSVNALLSTVDYLEKLVATTRSAVDSLNASQDDTVGDIINRFETSGLVGAEVDNIINSISSLTAMGTAEEMSAYLEPQLQSLEAQLATSKQNLTQAQQQLAVQEQNLKQAEQMVKRLNEVEASLKSAKAELDAAEKELENANSDIQYGELETLTKLQDMKYQITNLETNVRLAKSKAESAQQEYNASELSVNEKLEQAKVEIEAAKLQLGDLDSAISYVWDRDSALMGYEEYGQTVERTKALAVVFPWVFFIVAALVCLNSMSRMVEEERTQQGALKALGYTNGEISSKYVIYALICGILGSAIGACLGAVIIPFAVDKAYGILYDLPDIRLQLHGKYIVTGAVITVGSTLLASALASYSSLKAVPATLMRPKPPKNGKRVFLEKIGFVWSRLSFTSKVTVRNVVRNQKRFIMAVAGVMGCTALMLASFGLSDSIHALMKKQFTDSDRINQYDIQVALKTPRIDLDESTEIYSAVTQRPEVVAAMFNCIKVCKAGSAQTDKTMEIYLNVPQDNASLSHYVALRERQSGISHVLDDSGAIITEKLADTLHIGVGDEVLILRDGLQDVPIRVSAIVENYTFHYVYISRTVYQAVFGEQPGFNYITAVLADETEETQKQVLASELMKQSGVSAVSFTDELRSIFKNIISSLNYVVWMLIVSAGLLALIVLYNLSSININERVREIATIKVLGFDDGEVSAYIFRENLILSIIGTVIGLFVGIPLHRLIISVAEVDVAMFGRSIGVPSFVWAAILSMAFSLFVNVILFGRLKKVDMVESLKSVE